MAEDTDKENPVDKEEALVGWINGQVEDWEEYRQSQFDPSWREYYNLWRGIWSGEDNHRESERSKLISPALQQAIEAQVAELEEAVFGREDWFDLTDNYSDRRTDFQSPNEREQIQQAISEVQTALNEGKINQQQAQQVIQQVQQQATVRQTSDVEHMKNLMKENFDESDTKTNMSKIFLNGALYGTGIGKVVASEEVTKQYVQPEKEGDPVSVEDKDVLRVYIEPVSPFNFVIDPAATSIEDSLGCAHKVQKSKHSVYQKIKDGVYRDIDLDSMHAPSESDPPSMKAVEIGDPDLVEITEYWGLVPQSMLESESSEESEDSLDDALNVEGIPSPEKDDLVEAVVTLANGGKVLRAERNPFLMEDRPFVAYQHDTVPDTFWGRGVAEKGYNAQKALDGELRARMDGLALSVHPMMAYDVTSRPRGSSYTVHPGKSIGTTGPPKDALMPFNFGDINSKTFENAADMERMVQQATGSMDSAVPIEQNRRNETASGMSQIQSGAIKRSKRTLQNIEQKMITKFLKKAAWRFQQFDSKNFPMKDLHFIPHSSLGIMARELEQQQSIQLLSVVPQESQAFYILLKSVYENSNLSNRDELIQSINQQMQPDQTQEQIKQLQLAEQQAKVKVQQTEAQENRADAFKAIQEARKTAQDAELAQDQLDVDLMKEILDVVSNQQGQSTQQQTALVQELLKQTGAQDQEMLRQQGNQNPGNNA